MTTAPNTVGMDQRLLHEREFVTDIGASEAPKSTVFRICFTPPPEPMDW
jgi:hypothetical protein